jgi:hypothetical protein
MKSAALKKAPPIPTFQERWAAIVEELLKAPVEEQVEEQVEALKTLDEALDHALDLIAEERRPKGPNGIPVGLIRMQLDARGHGGSNLGAYIAAVKEPH